ncbi:putative holin-like toxin [Clostridium sp. ASF356]|nr:putative holin-like toxin [Clostridium sp. MD294]
MTGGHPLTYKKGEGVVSMTVYEAIMVMLTFGLFLIALLSYMNKK